MLIHLSWRGGTPSERCVPSADATTGHTWVFNSYLDTFGIQLSGSTPISTAMMRWRDPKAVFCVYVSLCWCEAGFGWPG